MISRNNGKSYYNNCVASAELTYGQPSQEAQMDIRDQAIDG